MSLQLPLVDVPRARVSDPETSHKAAAKVKTSGQLGRQQHEVLAYVQRFPGHTSAELAQRMADERGGVWQEYRPMFGRRLAELAVLHVRKGEPRLCPVCESKSVTWWPV